MQVEFGACGMELSAFLNRSPLSYRQKAGQTHHIRDPNILESSVLLFGLAFNALLTWATNTIFFKI